MHVLDDNPENIDKKFKVIANIEENEIFDNCYLNGCVQELENQISYKKYVLVCT